MSPGNVRKFMPSPGNFVLEKIAYLCRVIMLKSGVVSVMSFVKYIKWHTTVCLENTGPLQLI